MSSDRQEERQATRELKFVVGSSVAARLREWARTRLRADEHGGGAHADEYWTTSLYFDTRAYDVLHRRGSFGRAKYRIRRYGMDDLVYLERKLRTPPTVIKRRTAVAASLLPVFDFPCPTADWPGRWFHRRLLARRLQLACSVRYRRLARVLVGDGDPARLTIDEHLTVQSPRHWDFNHAGAVPLQDGEVIVEMKFRGVPPAAFRELMTHLKLHPQNVSKYRLGMAGLGHACVPPARPALGSREGARDC